MIKAENPCYIKLGNIWIIINSGGARLPARQSRLGVALLHAYPGGHLIEVGQYTQMAVDRSKNDAS